MPEELSNISNKMLKMYIKSMCLHIKMWSSAVNSKNSWKKRKREDNYVLFVILRTPKIIEDIQNKRRSINKRGKIQHKKLLKILIETVISTLRYNNTANTYEWINERIF